MYSEVTEILGDHSHDRETNLLRLQGWRDGELDQAAASGAIVRLGPAVCAVGTFIGVAIQSPALLGLVALTALIGLIAPNHPVEMLANAVTSRRGGTPQPPNKAGRRFGCLVGAILAGGSAFAYTVAAPAWGAGLGLTLAVIATFVATTNICVPSIIVTTFGGSAHCARSSLFTTGRTEAQR